MAEFQTVTQATLDRGAVGNVTRVSAGGMWLISTVSRIEPRIPQVIGDTGGRVILDLSGIERIDTAGAWLITRIQGDLEAVADSVELEGVSDPARRLLAAVERAKDITVETPKRRSMFILLLEQTGRSTVNAGHDLTQGMAILGGVIGGLLRGFARPSRFRFTSIVYHLDRAGLQAVPIVALISFLIGGIIAQQGVFQLRFFGAEDFVVDLVGILVLRELGVLLTAILLAGRSGSAFTAEIGSMKMREELDALKVIGLDPVEVLIMPRLVALIIALPLLTFVSDICGLIGGAFVTFIYGDMAFERFVLLLRDAIDMSTLMVGIIKAPFMGLIVGLIAANEGLNVEGSAESLGRRTTSSVVKAIFMVIVADGIFAIFFAAIDY
ncbi:MlaE family lipid ABC transporter permease subunit [Bauldia litoralis]|uniref:Phospholipid/cholesterol/gamma-HCH transport system permease protein n=1 Tax=Bauldia litoralis TaxID=665467 RepID=A0A1G6D814_9HYPH|nr:MlaE family lipid ABC transporter permease subunit [Bauldia litoralis]SDB41282.1 phospholipid/cholesterol/gamma-HCH transport system permease protein [Bauldia litoralis]